MTSTVQAETDARLPQILAALFPSASITGAPKVSTMQWIADLEDTPRGVYTGAIGWLSPGRQAEFGVAIRTVWVDRTRGEAEYGTGGGIVWDSVAAAEYDECRTKSLVLTARRPVFRLLETLLWEPDLGFFLLARHLDRLRSSARYFGFCVPEDVEARLLGFAAGLSSGRFRVRLLLDENGDLELDPGPLVDERPLLWKVGLAREPVATEDVFLFHKTTHRVAYEAARLPDCDDVLLWNTRGELTESTVANLVLKLDGRLLTPRADCGLLPGTFRAHLLETGEVAEAVLRKPDLEGASAIYLINSVRRWIPVTLARE
jgi:para-aminobenzoate synthetase/4-amino-4-deoxychorismate lyase